MSDSDDIIIELGDSKHFPKSRSRQLPSRDRSLYCAVYGKMDESVLPVYFRELALRGIEQHAASAGNEVGGALIGEIIRERGDTYVIIDDFIPARKAAERQATLTFTHETWSQLNADKDAKHPDLKIVGWYHTHPGMGVFLSDSDIFIHNNFFTSDGSIAFVVDPVNSDRAVFYRFRGKLEGVDGFYVFGDKSRRNEIDDLITRIHPLPSSAVRAGLRDGYGEPAAASGDILINPYYLMPKFLRRILNIRKSETAPKLSLKSFIIIILLGALVTQHIVMDRQSAREIKNLQAVTVKTIKDNNVKHYLDYLSEHPDETAYIELWRACNANEDEKYLGDVAKEIRKFCKSKVDRKDYKGAYELMLRAMHSGDDLKRPVIKVDQTKVDKWIQWIIQLAREIPSNLSDGRQQQKDHSRAAYLIGYKLLGVVIDNYLDHISGEGAKQKNWYADLLRDVNKEVVPHLVAKSNQRDKAQPQYDIACGLNRLLFEKELNAEVVNVSFPEVRAIRDVVALLHRSDERLINYYRIVDIPEYELMYKHKNTKDAEVKTTEEKAEETTRIIAYAVKKSENLSFTEEELVYQLSNEVFKIYKNPPKDKDYRGAYIKAIGKVYKQAPQHKELKAILKPFGQYIRKNEPKTKTPAGGL